MIEGKILTGSGGGTITYTLTPRGASETVFAREFVYPVPPLYVPLDLLFLRGRIHAESAEALRRLKRLLEST